MRSLRNLITELPANWCEGWRKCKKRKVRKIREKWHYRYEKSQEFDNRAIYNLMGLDVILNKPKFCKMYPRSTQQWLGLKKERKPKLREERRNVRHERSEIIR